MQSMITTFRSLAIVAALVGGTSLFASTAEAGGCHPAPKVVYVPVQTVYVQPVPVRKVIVVHPAPVYRPACH